MRSFIELRRIRNIPASSLVAAALFLVTGGAMLATGRRDYPNLHTILDSAVFVLSGVLSWFFWRSGVRTSNRLSRWLALGFGLTSLAELVHVLVTVEWSGALEGIHRAQAELRPGTWPVAAYLLPIALIWGVLRMRGRLLPMRAAALGLIAVGLSLFVAFRLLPRYTAPGWLGISRPTLDLVPLLWAAASALAYRERHADRVLPAMLFAGVVLFAGHASMLYSRAPHDTEAMVAHLGKVTAYLILLLALMQMASLDMLERIRAESALAEANSRLEQRVRDRTAEIEAANLALRGEMLIRWTAEAKAQAQVVRLNVLHHVTRAIAERQDLQSILHVVLRSLEDDLAMDFSAVGLYDRGAHLLRIISVGPHSEALGREMALTVQARVPIDANGLSRCIGGELIYEPDIRSLALPFTESLARGGLRSLVLAPLIVERAVFGVLIGARHEPEAFSSGDCESLKQLSEHTALAAHQAELYGSLQQAYDDLRQTQHAVMQQERLRALGQMASGIAHDINNAISPIALYADLLKREPGLSDKGRAHLKTIQRSVADVAQTIDRLREFSRRREMPSALTPVNLNLLIPHVVELTRARWSDMPHRSGAAIEIVQERVSAPPPVLAVESEIREALINLVFNAVDAMPDGGMLTLRTRQEVQQSSGLPSRELLHLEVTDTGIGMDEETLQRCQEPFFTTKGDRGTGLGLAMVYGIAKRHAAAVEIESAPGKGTTVRLTFVVPPAHAPAGVAPAEEESSLAPLRILIIDDEPLILSALGDLLEIEGHQVTAAHGGQEGIDVFLAANSAGEPFSVVITDLGMPHVGGRQVAEAVKAGSPETPVILLTGWGQRLAADGDLPPSVDQVLSKPPEPHELQAVLARATARARPGKG